MSLALHHSVLDQVRADAAAGLLAEAVAEDDESDHCDESEELREDFGCKQDGIEDSVGEDRSSEDPEPVDLRCHRIKTDERVVISHEDSKEEMTWNREQCAGNSRAYPVLR